MIKLVGIIVAASLSCSTLYNYSYNLFYPTAVPVMATVQSALVCTPAPTHQPHAVQLVSRGFTIQDKTTEAINKYLAGGLLEKHGDTFFRAGQKHKVDSKVLAAIAIHETSVDGIPGISEVIRTTNNVGGINWTKYTYVKQDGKLIKILNPYKKAGWYNKYDSIEESIFDMAARLEMFYIDEGRTTLEAIGAKWAPTNDKRNGIGGMDNNSWVPHVTSVYNSIVSEMQKGR